MQNGPLIAVSEIFGMPPPFGVAGSKMYANVRRRSAIVRPSPKHGIVSRCILLKRRTSSSPKM